VTAIPGGGGISLSFAGALLRIASTFSRNSQEGLQSQTGLPSSTWGKPAQRMIAALRWMNFTPATLIVSRCVWSKRCFGRDVWRPRGSLAPNDNGNVSRSHRMTPDEALALRAVWMRRRLGESLPHSGIPAFTIFTGDGTAWSYGRPCFRGTRSCRTMW